MKIAICLLAGGAGSRIGGGKPLRCLDGRPLIAYTHDVACHADAPLWLSLRSGADATALNAALGTSLPVIVDACDVPGPIGAIVAALRAAGLVGLDAIVTLPCDAPFLPSDIVSRLIDALVRADVAVAGTGGRLHPVCAVWRVSALAVIEQEIAAGRFSLRGAANAAAAVAVGWPDPCAFININTIEQLEHAAALIGQKRNAQRGSPTPTAALPAGRRTSQSATASGDCDPED